MRLLSSSMRLCASTCGRRVACGFGGTAHLRVELGRETNEAFECMARVALVACALRA